MGWLKSIVDSQETTAGRVFDRLVHTLIVFSLISFALETMPGLVRYQRWFEVSEIVVVVFFTVEYCARLIVAPKWWRYALSLGGLIDLAAILPFYVSFGAVDLRSIRAFRLLRLLRVAKVGRYQAALRDMREAFREIREELMIYFGITFMLVYLASVGIYFFENEAQPEAFRSVPEAMWWAVVTLTTVGYGDVVPITVAGRAFTFLVLLLGLSVVSVPSALLASALVGQRSKTRAGAAE